MIYPVFGRLRNIKLQDRKIRREDSDPFAEGAGVEHYTATFKHNKRISPVYIKVAPCNDYEEGKLLRERETYARISGCRNIARLVPLELHDLARERKCVATEYRGMNTLGFSKINHYRKTAAALADACEALEDLHSMRMVHRDVKPANIAAGQNPNGVFGYLLDFDLCVKAGPMIVYAGTTGYVPPEIRTLPEAENLDVGPSYDAYSMARTIKCCLFNELMFHEGLERAVDENLSEDPIERSGVAAMRTQLRKVAEGEERSSRRYHVRRS